MLTYQPRFLFLILDVVAFEDSGDLIVEELLRRLEARSCEAQENMKETAADPNLADARTTCGEDCAVSRMHVVLAKPSMANAF